MKIGIMQPYFFPYLGYFQLIDSVDLFVLHDDVQFIKSGWVHRNRYLRDGKPVWFGLSLAKASSFALINERHIAEDFDPQSMIRKLDEAYRRAARRQYVIDMVSEVVSKNEKSLAAINERGLRAICGVVNITTPIISSSSLQLPSCLTGQQRVIEIVRRCQGTHYINPIGGLSLYSEAEFAKNGIELSFHRMLPCEYNQGVTVFEPSLSIVDVLMHVEPTQMPELLQSKQIESFSFYQ